MTGVFIILGGMVLFATGVCVYDILSRRQQRRARGQHRSA